MPVTEEDIVKQTSEALKKVSEINGALSLQKRVLEWLISAADTNQIERAKAIELSEIMEAHLFTIRQHGAL